MLRTNIGIFALAAAITAVNPALADVGASATVRYADLNLANPAGVAALHRRIESAVRAVCPDASNELVMQAQMSSCRKQARQSAGIQVAVVLDQAQRLANSGSFTLLASR